MAPLSSTQKSKAKRERESEKKRLEGLRLISKDADRDPRHQNQNAACKSKGKRTIEGETLTGPETNIRATRGAFSLSLARHICSPAIKKEYSPQGPQKLRERRVIGERRLLHWSRL